MDTGVSAYFLIRLGYNDYIAARHLINNRYVLQGVTLASTAVEKYVKVILVSKGKTKKEIGVHLDRIDKLKQQLESCYTDFTKRFDERFLDILGKAYRSRYYDDLKEPITIGFFINQFLCELDHTIAVFENIIFQDIVDGKGNKILTPYKKGIEDRLPDLMLNNFLFSGLTKKQFMEQPDDGFCIYINPHKWNGDFYVKGQGIKNTYDGKMATINIKFGNNNKSC